MAELGNGSVSVIDLRAKRGLQRLKGFREPQGVGYVGTTDTLYVASGGDRSLRVFQGTSLEEGPAIKLGDDADNVRIQPDEKRVFVGYGRGALAIVDVESNRKLADIELPAHPESFRLESGGERIFVNLPDDRSVVVVDRNSRATVARWPTPGAGGNFPMALDEGRQRVLVVFRQPAKLAALSMADGTETAAAETCGDSDDVSWMRSAIESMSAAARGSWTSSRSRMRDFDVPTTLRPCRALEPHYSCRSWIACSLPCGHRGGEPAAIWVYAPGTAQ